VLPSEDDSSGKKNRRSDRAKKITSIPDLAFEQIRRAQVAWLDFDYENPRLVDKDLGSARAIDVIEELIKSADLKELVESIASNGYIDIEPLVVMRRKSGGKYSVLEGNRRLAALQLLNNPALAREVGFQLPGVTGDAETFKSASVYRVEDRTRARAYIGFKHINGPHAWDSLAKGRFAADWYKREKGRGVSLRDIARKLGDGHATVKRLVQAIYVLDQARDEGIFTVEDRYPGKPFGFSHLYIALTRPGYRKFLDLAPDWQSSDPSPNPVPKSAMGNLRQLLVWLYGSTTENVPPAITSQNPDIKRLGEVLDNPIARKEMLASSNLDVAYGEVQTEALQFEQALLRSYRHAEEAQGKLSSFEGEDDALVEVGSRLNKAAAFIYTTMETVQKKAKRERLSSPDTRN
jgi:hypothetical protein